MLTIKPRLHSVLQNDRKMMSRLVRNCIKSISPITVLVFASVYCKTRITHANVVSAIRKSSLLGNCQHVSSILTSKTNLACLVLLCLLTFLNNNLLLFLINQIQHCFFFNFCKVLVTNVTFIRLKKPLYSLEQILHI